MALDLRFAIASDLHIGLPQTIGNHPSRFHLVEVSIPALEKVLDHFEPLELDFLLLPGDLTQDGEPENHQWLQQRLARLPYPVYVVPGNHDVPTLLPSDHTIGWAEFPSYYQNYGYTDTSRLYYTAQLQPGVRLIALNSNMFDHNAQQLGALDGEQLAWLETVLDKYREQFLLVMVHHNLIEHLPGQSRHALGKRYMLDNGPEVLTLLRSAGVKLIFTGHLHIQDIAQSDGMVEITTGSLVSYPHPYRLLHLQTDDRGYGQLTVASHRVEQVPGWENLSQHSRQWMSDHSEAFMLTLLTSPPVSLPLQEAKQFVPQLRYFWADIAAGDRQFDFPDMPLRARRFFQRFGAINAMGQYHPIDNDTVLTLQNVE